MNFTPLLVEMPPRVAVPRESALARRTKHSAPRKGNAPIAHRNDAFLCSVVERARRDRVRPRIARWPSHERRRSSMGISR